MKKLSLILSFFLIPWFCSAQEATFVDVIYLYDGSRLKGEIVDKDASENVTIRILDGSTLIIPKQIIQSTQRFSTNKIFLPGWQTIRSKGVYTLLQIGINFARSDRDWAAATVGANIFHLSLGKQFNPHLAVGAGIGLDKIEYEFIPLYLECRGDMLKKRFSPHYALRVGYGFEADLFDLEEGNDVKGGLMIHPALALRIATRQQKNILLEMGYQFQYARRTSDFRNGVDRLLYRRLSLRLGWLF